MAVEEDRMPVAEPELTAVIVADSDDGLAPTLDAVAGFAAIVARPWPARSASDGPPLPAGTRVVTAAGDGATAALNAALAHVATSAFVVLSAGDVPAAGVLDAHAAALASGADAVAGALAPDIARDAWVGPVPPWLPAYTRHASFRVAVLLQEGGFDDRLHALEIAVPETLARLAAARRSVRIDAALTVRAPSATTSRLREIGRSAQTLACRTEGATTARAGARHAAVTLRWSAPLLRAFALDARMKALTRRAAFAEGRGLPALDDREIARLGTPPPAAGPGRPAISIVVPFAGDTAKARTVLDALATVARRPGDEVIVVDNARSPVVEASDEVCVARADAEWSSYHARNTGAARAANDWLLFVDADCRPVPDVLDAYFSPPPAARTGAVAGAVLAARNDDGVPARYSADAGVLSQARSLEHPYRPYAVTANLLVRRAALDDLGGFCEGVRSGGDAELTWRLQEAGWELEHRWRAAVEHRHRTTMRGLLRQYGRYGAGVAWHERHRPGSSAAWLRLRARPLRAAVVDVAAGRFWLATTRVIALACQVAACVGALQPNRPSRAGTPRHGGTTAFADTWPSADAIASDADVIEARARPLRLRRDGAAPEVWYREDDAARDRLAALRWLARSRDGRLLIAAAARQGRGAVQDLAAGAAVAARVARRKPQRIAVVNGTAEDARAVERILAAAPSCR